PVPVVSNDGPVCEGDIVHLSATNVTGFDYDWYGPNGFHSFSSNTTIYSVELADSGVYTFIVNQGSCSSSASTTVQVYPVPAVPVITQNGTILEAPSGYAAYEWYYNYGFTPVGTSQTYNAGMNYGNYTVIVFSAGGCSEESNDFDYIWTAADMPESGIAVAVFPNPFRHSTNLAISLPEAAQVEAKLMTITGEEAAVLYSGNLQSGKHAISIDADALNLSAGIYVVQLQIDQATYHVRIAVQ
ncbi:MAG: T9SS type A sorting domain-containing protein, partial [Bacteroidetes bacterium]|nr:T9SS type A sorting domain-containing protein [Bacteroidota bacterium]